MFCFGEFFSYTNKSSGRPTEILLLSVESIEIRAHLVARSSDVEHWDFAMELEKSLVDNPRFAKRFADEIGKAEKAATPTRYQRKPVI